MLGEILLQEITPELIPVEEGTKPQATEDSVGPYNLQDFTLFHVVRRGHRPSKIAFLAWHAWRDAGRGGVAARLPRGRPRRLRPADGQALARGVRAPVLRQPVQALGAAQRAQGQRRRDDEPARGLADAERRRGRPRGWPSSRACRTRRPTWPERTPRPWRRVPLRLRTLPTMRMSPSGARCDDARDAGSICGRTGDLPCMHAPRWRQPPSCWAPRFVGVPAASAASAAPTTTLEARRTRRRRLSLRRSAGDAARTGSSARPGPVRDAHGPARPRGPDGAHHPAGRLAREAPGPEGSRGDVHQPRGSGWQRHVPGRLGQFVPGKVGRTYDWVGPGPARRRQRAGRPSPATAAYNKIGTRPPYEPRTQAILDAWVSRSAAYAADCGTVGGGRPAAAHEDDRHRGRLRGRCVRRSAPSRSASTDSPTAPTSRRSTPRCTPSASTSSCSTASSTPATSGTPRTPPRTWRSRRRCTVFFRWAARGHAELRLGRTGGPGGEDLLPRCCAGSRAGPSPGSGPPSCRRRAGGGLREVPVAGGGGGAVGDRHPGHRAPGPEGLQVSVNPTTAGGDNGYATYLATICTDAPWPTDLATLLADNERQDRRHPFLTWPNGWFNAPCRTWPAPPAAAAVEVAPRPGRPCSSTRPSTAATPIDGCLRGASPVQPAQC